MSGRNPFPRGLVRALALTGHAPADDALVVRMVSIALLPWGIGHCIDAMTARDGESLLRWSVVLLALSRPAEQAIAC